MAKRLECDVAVIGAGTAGLAAERSARRAGAHTLLAASLPRAVGTIAALWMATSRLRTGFWPKAGVGES